MKLHRRAVARLFERNDQVLDAEEVRAGRRPVTESFATSRPDNASCA
ncbi:MAG: hypothetical protein U0736_01955 [Gemmataceae bacterium]